MWRTYNAYMQGRDQVLGFRPPNEFLFFEIILNIFKRLLYIFETCASYTRVTTICDYNT